MWQERTDEEVPLGFGISLAQNTAALRAFSRLSAAQRESVLSGARQIRSRREMEAYVDALTDAGGSTQIRE